MNYSISLLLFQPLNEFKPLTSKFVSVIHQEGILLVLTQQLD